MSYKTVDLVGVIPNDGFFVIATANAGGDTQANRDMTAAIDWQNGPDAVRLVDPDDAVVDALQYGNAGNFNSGEGAFAPDVSPGRSLTRDGMHSDTDDNATDFASSDGTYDFSDVGGRYSLLRAGLSLRAQQRVEVARVVDGPAVAGGGPEPERQVDVQPPAGDAQVAVDQLAMALGEPPVRIRPHRRARREHVPRQQARHHFPEAVLLRGLEPRILREEVHGAQRRRGRRARKPRGNP